jgi:N-acetylglucosaminyldiphosphoundecaprenol N-acetyl-beta-D-mannosaminyltransferase
MDSDAIVEAVNRSEAGLLLVALGHPKQDQWIARNRHRLSPSVAIGVGCCFDLMAGRSRRAPAAFQRTGLEWMFRLAQEPRRLFRRYAVDGIWLVMTVGALLLAGRASRS